MRKLALLLSAFALLAGCSAKDEIALFGLTLGDDAKNAPDSTKVDDLFGEKLHHYTHTSELDGSWEFYYTLKYGVISSIGGHCKDDIRTVRALFSICKNWIRKSVPFDHIEEESESRFEVASDSVNAVCEFATDPDATGEGDAKAIIHLKVALSRNPNTKGDPDLSK